MIPLVEIDRVAVVRRSTELLTDVSLRISRGQSVAIVGESGAGKSLTCRLLTGTLPRIGAHVARGSVRYQGKDLTAMTDRDWRRFRRQFVGFVPQASLAGLNPVRSIRSQLREAFREVTGASPDETRLVRAMGEVRLEPAGRVLDSHPAELSGGMRQRVMIALALVGEPELLIADEPTTALDATVQREVLDLMRDLRERRGMAMLLVSHDLSLVAEESEDLVIMYAGETVEWGPTEQVMSTPLHPYTRALLDARPGVERRGLQLETIPGSPPSPPAWPSGCRFASRCHDVIDPCRAEPPPVWTDDARSARCVHVGGS